MISNDVKQHCINLIKRTYYWESVPTNIHTVPEAYGKSEQGVLQTWYEIGDYKGCSEDFYLQVNELSVNQNFIVYMAGVFALKYAICAAWVPVVLQLNPTTQLLKDKELSLIKLLDRRAIEDEHSRQQLRSQYPYCDFSSWKMIAKYGPPFLVFFRDGVISWHKNAKGSIGEMLFEYHLEGHTLNTPNQAGETTSDPGKPDE